MSHLHVTCWDESGHPAGLGRAPDLNYPFPVPVRLPMLVPCAHRLTKHGSHASTGLGAALSWGERRCRGGLEKGCLNWAEGQVGRGGQRRLPVEATGGLSPE